MKKIVTTIGFIIYLTSLVAQETTRNTEHTASFKSQYTQIKDEFNYGLVNRGLNLVGEYALVSHIDKNIFSYLAELGFGMNYNQGLGLIWSFKPFDFFYGFRINNNPEMPITLGPYLAGYYMWQLYPELQSGHMFWMSSYELGPRLQVSLPVKGKILHFSLATSIASLNSRPEYETEQYYYSLTFSDFVSNPHTNMTFGSMDIFNHIDFKVELARPARNFSIAYEFEYIGYLDEPTFRYMAHSINLNWIIGNKKSN